MSSKTASFENHKARRWISEAYLRNVRYRQTTVSGLSWPSCFTLTALNSLDDSMDTSYGPRLWLSSWCNSSVPPMAASSCTPAVQQAPGKYESSPHHDVRCRDLLRPQYVDSCRPRSVKHRSTLSGSGRSIMTGALSLEGKKAVGPPEGCGYLRCRHPPAPERQRRGRPHILRHAARVISGGGGFVVRMDMARRDKLDRVCGAWRAGF
jgi:hypothetical protein